MDELFRFVALRPPLPASDEIVVDGTSPLAVSLAAARDTPHGRDTMNRLAHEYVESKAFVRDSSRLTLRLDQLADALEETDSSDDLTTDDLVKRVLGSSAAGVVNTPEFRSDLAHLQDSLLAVKLAPTTSDTAATILRLLSVADVVQRSASGMNDLAGSPQRLVRLPASVFPLLTRVVPPVAPPAPSDQPTQDELLERAGALDDAIQALSAIEQAIQANAAQAATGQVVHADAPSERSDARHRPEASLPVRAGTLLLDAAAISRLSTDVRRTLSELGIDPATTTLPSMLQMLKTELGRVERMLL